MAEVLMGKVIHYYAGISVAGLELSDTLKVGDTIHIMGKTTDFTQQVASMQIEHRNVMEAGAGQRIGLKVIDRVRDGDKVYKVE
jgi:selenocysteine-specific translation elongation factor